MGYNYLQAHLSIGHLPLLLAWVTFIIKHWAEGPGPTVIIIECNWAVGPMYYKYLWAAGPKAQGPIPIANCNYKPIVLGLRPNYNAIIFIKIGPPGPMDLSVTISPQGLLLLKNIRPQA